MTTNKLTLAYLVTLFPIFSTIDPGQLRGLDEWDRCYIVRKCICGPTRSHMNCDFLSNLRHINQFLALFYVTTWLKSNADVDSSANDLEFLHNMIKCQTEDAMVINAAFEKLSSHTSYLTKTAVAFSLFSNQFMMTTKVKESIALRLFSTLSSDQFYRRLPQFRATVDAQTQLPDFVGQKCGFCFKRSIWTTADCIFLQNFGWQKSHFKEGNIL